VCVNVESSSSSSYVRHVIWQCNVAVVGTPACQSPASGPVRIQRHRAEDEQHERRLPPDARMELYTDLRTPSLSLYPSLPFAVYFCRFLATVAAGERAYLSLQRVVTVMLFQYMEWRVKKSWWTAVDRLDNINLESHNPDLEYRNQREYNVW